MDLLRGLALLVIALDHIVGNPVAEVTPVSWGYSDMAEVFLFLSGFVAGMSALKRRSQGQKIFSRFVIRSLQIYACYIATTCVLLVFARQPGLSSQARHFGENLLTGPWWLALQDVLLLRGIASHLCILVLYLFLLSTFPFVLEICRWDPRWLSLLSLTFYAATQLAGLRLPGSLQQTAYYNPFAWQLIFYLGTVTALSGDKLKPLLWNRITLLGACWVLGTLHILYLIDLSPVWLRMKPSLGPLRVIHFVCLAILARAIIPRKLSASWLSWAFIVCGRHSLATYCTGAVASTIASIWITRAGRDPLHYFEANMFVTASLITVAAGLERLAQSSQVAQNPNDNLCVNGENETSPPE